MGKKDLWKLNCFFSYQSLYGNILLVSQSAHLLLCIISRCVQLPRGWGSRWGGGGGERKKEVLRIVAHTSPSLLL